MIYSTDDHWEAVAAEWRSKRKDRLWRDHSDAVNRALLRFWRPGRSFKRLLKTDLFDEAVGHGLIACLHDHADTVVGMDISRATIRAARENGTSFLPLKADAKALPMASKTFDAVFSNSTLDHFGTRDELITALGELHRVLKDDGQLLLTMDNLFNPMIALRNLIPYKILRKIGLVEYYVGITCGPRQLRRILEQTGFKVCGLEAVLHCPRALCVWIARCLQNRGSHRLQQSYLMWLMRFERLGRWPTRFLTGYFLAVRARRCGRHGETGTD